MNWNDIEKAKSNGCFFKLIKKNDKTDEYDGTKITLTEIKRKTPIDIQDLAIRLSQRFNFEDDFSVKVIDSNKNKEIQVTNDLKTSNLNVEWEFPIGDKQIPKGFEQYKGKIHGCIRTTKTPLPNKEMEGVTLLARNKLVNEPTSLGSVSSNFFRHISGEIHIDFIEDDEEDLIATNRRTLNWDNEKLIPLEECLRKIINNTEREWHEKRGKKVKEKVSKKLNIDIEKYQETLPKDKRKPVQKLLFFAAEHPEHEDDIVNQTLKIVEEYAAFHWRYLHPELKKEVKIYNDYKKADYASAVTKAWEIHDNQLQKMHNETEKSGMDLVSKYLKPDEGKRSLQKFRQRTTTRKRQEKYKRK